MTKKKFLALLKKARELMVAGKAPCSAKSKGTYCHLCALSKAGLFSGEYVLDGVKNNPYGWSLRNSDEKVLAMLDNSIAALEPGVQ